MFDFLVLRQSYVAYVDLELAIKAIAIVRARAQVCALVWCCGADE